MGGRHHSSLGGCSKAAGQETSSLIISALVRSSFDWWTEPITQTAGGQRFCKAVRFRDLGPEVSNFKFQISNLKLGLRFGKRDLGSATLDSLVQQTGYAAHIAKDVQV